MYISRVRIDGFGKLKDLDLSLTQGVNLITGPNESGKSTLHLFIRSMLYGASEARKGGLKSDIERMRPRHSPEVYGGTVELSSEGTLYRIERDFNVSPTDLKLYRIEGERAALLPDPEGALKSLLSGMSESMYTGTLAIGQLKAETGKGLNDEIISYAVNAETTANPALSALKSLEFLARRKREFQAAIEPDAHRSYNITLGKIRSEEEGLRDEKNANLIFSAIKERDDASREVDEIAVKKAAKEEEILNVRESLRESGLDSLSDTEKLIADTEQTYREYSVKRSRAPILKAVGMVLILLSAGALAVGMGYLDIPLLYEKYVSMGDLSLILTGAMFILGLILLIWGIAQGARAASLEDELNGILKLHLDRESGGAVTASDMQRFALRADKYREATGHLDSLRAERDELSAMLGKAGDKYSLKIRELDEQLKVRDAVEEKMQRLNALSARAERERRTVERNEALSTEIEAVELAADVIRELSQRIADTAGTYINKETGRMIEGLTLGKYRSVEVGRGPDMRLMGDGAMIPVKELSQGTMDQVYLALRLAAGRLAAGREDPMPLMMDDSFAMYDDERLRGSLRFIADNFHGQVILLSCQQREGDALKELGIEHIAQALAP